ncbi:MAG: hypothetical protein INH41_08915 [Myxococcaceae bacterium]|nr:hypothetical protein [Myxococcaceae bacterium]MCA3012505.1 hypothetical protein [Myxococcaceae bacterium]
MTPIEQNLHARKPTPLFAADMTPLLATGQAWPSDDASEFVLRELIERLPGAP